MMKGDDDDDYRNVYVNGVVVSRTRYALYANIGDDATHLQIPLKHDGCLVPLNFNPRACASAQNVRSTRFGRLVSQSRSKGINVREYIFPFFYGYCWWCCYCWCHIGCAPGRNRCCGFAKVQVRSLPSCVLACHCCIALCFPTHPVRRAAQSLTSGTFAVAACWELACCHVRTVRTDSRALMLRRKLGSRPPK